MKNTISFNDLWNKMKKLFIITSLISLGACGFKSVDTGNIGIQKRFGELVGEPLPPGLQLYNPFTSSVAEFDVREQKVDSKSACNTKDTQVVEITYTATFAPESKFAFDIYRQYGEHWIEAASIPSIIEAQIKIAIGKHDAGELVNHQDEAAHASFVAVKDALTEKHVRLGTLSFRNIDFSKEFEKAVEDKVVAEQSAKQAKNKTIQVEEEAKQTVLSAKAEAESMRIKSQALAQNKGLVAFEAVHKWDGKLPVNMYGSAPLPFLNIKGD